MNSPFLNSPISGTRAAYNDQDMILDLFISDESEVCVMHDKPFSKTLSWLEYDSKNSTVDFIMEDGDLRNFGIPVDRKYRAYFHNTHVVNMILWNPVTKKLESGAELPLIVQAA